MEQILQLIYSYFQFRAAVLRTLSHQVLSKSEFSKITGLDGNSKYRRRNNPSLWKPVEIHRLAVNLGLISPNTNRLRDLALLIDQLPPAEKKQVMKYGALTEPKLVQRLSDQATWQAQELTKLAAQLAKRQTSGVRVQPVTFIPGKQVQYS